jgi:sec-independent protein translocase protein TatA
MPFIGDIGVPGLIIILIIALLVLGPGKLPEVGEALGRGIREFRRATDLSGDSRQAATSSPAQSASPGAAPAAQAPVAEAPAAQAPSTAAEETDQQRIARLSAERDQLAAELEAARAAAARSSDEGTRAS